MPKNSKAPLGRVRIGEIQAGNINEWLVDYRDLRTGGEVMQNTRLRAKRYVSTFCSWAFVHYDLSENPMDKVMANAGTAPEHIVAIRRETEVRA